MFFMVSFRHINPVKEHPGRITKTNRRIDSNLNYEEIEFPVQKKKKKLKRLKYKITFVLMCLVMKMS